MSGLRVGDFRDSTHCGLEGHGRVRFRCHPWMDWLTTHRVVIDYEGRRVTAYTHEGIHVTFQGDKHDDLPETMYDSRWHG